MCGIDSWGRFASALLDQLSSFAKKHCAEGGSGFVFSSRGIERNKEDFLLRKSESCYILHFCVQTCLVVFGC